MTQITLYTGGGVSLSPVYADGRTESDYVRLVADEGMMLKKGKVTLMCVDVSKADISNWNEVEYVEPDKHSEEEALTRYANELTGAQDETLTEATETLIKIVKEDM